MPFTHKIVKNFLTKEECDEILNFSLENLKLEPSHVVGYKSKSEVDKVDDNVRKSNQVFYKYFQHFPVLLEKTTKLLNDTINVKGFDLNYEHNEFQFTEYNIGDFFNWHTDSDKDNININEFNRYCSIVIQLNDDYDAGDLEISITNEEPIVVDKGVGNLILFSSDIQHRVTTIQSGQRYTLVNWVGLKKQNNYKKTLL
jgi:Rps23 Pro-64 3,4-dihydroxylase Tpa1-like proline 4-hydroxylase